MTPEFAQAFVNFQSETSNIKKGKEGYNYNYADLASVIDYCKPLLFKHGFAISQILMSEDGKPGLLTTLIHKSGDFMEGWIELEKVLMKGCSNAQQMGSAISYYRRYAWLSILGLATEDDDAKPEGEDKWDDWEDKTLISGDGSEPPKAIINKPKQGVN